jgi:hypothetical protein
MKKIKAWYFAPEDNKLRYGDGRSINIGETHTVAGKPKLCENGLHASERLIDALQYVPGSILYEVELSGEFDVGDNKLCATNRTYLRGINATNLLKSFARKQALINIDKIKPYCCESDYSLIINYLTNGEEELRLAARSAAESARSAAWSAARSAARSAAWSAARSAAWSAAESAAWSAAESARSAAESAAESAAWSAARSAAWSAARSAARSATNEMLTQMVLEEFAKQGLEV